MEPLVSILIPAHNAAKSIALTLESATRQTWPRTEVIVVDDGSTDETTEVVRPFLSPSVLLVRQENQGAASARNRALALSQGEYIQWLDADDLLSVSKISKQMRVLLDCGVRTLACCEWGSFRHRPNAATFVPTPLWEDLDPLEWLIRKWEHNCYMQTATWLSSRELAEAAGPWDPRLLGDDDGEYFARVVRQSSAIKFVPGARVYYRQSGAARLSHIGMSKAKMDAQLLGMELQIKYLLEMADNDRVRRACLTYLETWLPNFHPHEPGLVSRAQALAAEVGGNIGTPSFPWKYDWIRMLFGARTAKRAQVRYNELKSAALGAIDLARQRLAGEVDVSRI